jgi:hypothetical protein
VMPSGSLNMRLFFPRRPTPKTLLRVADLVRRVGPPRSDGR